MSQGFVGFVMILSGPTHLFLSVALSRKIPFHFYFSFSFPFPSPNQPPIFKRKPRRNSTISMASSDGKLELRTLGNTGLKLSCVGFGASPLGNVFGPVSQDDADASVREAFRLGINFFDTSPYVLPQFLP